MVLAAGAASRFGANKLLAPLDGRPVLDHVLAAARDAGFGEIVVVLGHRGREIERAIRWHGERRVHNPDPDRGLSSSLQLGLQGLGRDVDAAVILLGDQPRVRVDVIGALLADAPDPDRPIVVPEYPTGGGPNPALLLRPAWSLADRLAGDRGMGPLIAAHPELVRRIPVPGDNPDVDTPDDLRALAARPPQPAWELEAAWRDRVRANRDQVDRFREVPDGADFYGPVSSLFLADPRRADEPVLDVLRGLVVPGESWIDIGAGAGRYALPIALVAGEVIAVDPSPGMLGALEEQQRDHGIPNVRAFEGRWPPDERLVAALGSLPCADVALIAHVGYDIEEIAPFLDAMEAAARRLCVAVLMERQPSSIADVCWPPVHGEARISLPALPDLVELLRARGRAPEVVRVDREPRRFEERRELERFLRRQLWVAEGSDKDRVFLDALAGVVVEDDGRYGLASQGPMPVGVVTWVPR